MKKQKAKQHSMEEYAVVYDIMKHKNELDMLKFNLLMSFYRLCYREYADLNQKDQISSV